MNAIPASWPALGGLAILMMLIGLAMLYPMARYARRIGESSGYWLSLTVLLWGFAWVGYRFVYRYFLSRQEESPARMILLGSLLAMALLLYGLVWWRLIRQGRKVMEKRIEEIGRNE